MEAKLQKQIIDFFAFFEETYNSTKSGLKECQKCAIAINKLLFRYKNIKEAQLKGSPLEDFSDIQSKLCDKIHNLIFKEVQIIKEEQTKIEEQCDKLCQKQKCLTDSCKQSELSPGSTIVRGSPWQPPLSQLLRFSEDTVTFASQICALVETALSVLSFKGPNTLSLPENFQIPKDWQEKATEILSYTSFCAENQL